MTSMLASSSESTADRILSVRFEDACILIPPPGPAKSALRPRIITKSYSLPLWKTSSSKRSANTQSPVSPEASQAPNTEAERKAFSLTVSVPSLTTKSRPRRSSIPPSSPCLSKRQGGPPQSPDSSTPSSTVSFPTVTSPIAPYPTLHRVPSFPQIQPATLKQADTVPLRPCCEACHSCVDAALAQGESWSARWSTGAVRRYSEGEHVHLYAPHPPVFGVTRVWTSKTEGADADGDMHLQDALTIDEVDVKRRSGDYSQATLNNHHVPPPATEDTESDDEDASPENTAGTLLIPLYHTAILKEEDEDLLFPLPSPRRSPNHSPDLTPTGSQVNLATPPLGGETNPCLFGSQTNLSTPAISSLVSQDNKLCASVAQTPVTARPPPIPATPTEPAPEPSPTRSLSSSPVFRRQRSSSPEETRRSTGRRSSFSTASETFLRSSTSMLKGVAVGMMGGGGGVGALR